MEKTSGKPPLPLAAQLSLQGKREPGRFWSLRQAAGRPDTLQMYLYGDVEGGWWDWWTDEYHESDTSAEYFREELGKYPDVREIEIFINSYGGEVFEGT
ncbi:MAG: hypothetical protein IJV41_08285, partial [Oscillospiraceae bacterium]|nr:hypothetical protein [Oscillospiraceae bacterium]